MQAPTKACNLGGTLKQKPQADGPLTTLVCTFVSLFSRAAGFQFEINANFLKHGKFNTQTWISYLSVVTSYSNEPLSLHCCTAGVSWSHIVTGPLWLGRAPTSASTLHSALPAWPCGQGTGTLVKASAALYTGDWTTTAPMQPTACFCE